MLTLPTIQKLQEMAKQRARYTAAGLSGDEVTAAAKSGLILDADALKNAHMEPQSATDADAWRDCYVNAFRNAYALGPVGQTPKSEAKAEDKGDDKPAASGRSKSSAPAAGAK